MTEQVKQAFAFVMGFFMVSSASWLVMEGRMGICLPGSPEYGRLFIGQTWAEACSAPKSQAEP